MSRVRRRTKNRRVRSLARGDVLGDEFGIDLAFQATLGLVAVLEVADVVAPAVRADGVDGSTGMVEEADVVADLVRSGFDGWTGWRAWTIAGVRVSKPAIASSAGVFGLFDDLRGFAVLAGVTDAVPIGPSPLIGDSTLPVTSTFSALLVVFS
ncbi:hypothetical protein EGH26_11085 [Halomicroarcula pellucida]|nr:hypothetical protein [Halomicroarcula pellucida]